MRHWGAPGSSGDRTFTVSMFLIAYSRHRCMTAPKTPPNAMPHQEVGTQFLREREAAALFDEQGLGKSKQMIEAIALDIAAGVLDGALIVCPNILKSTWA